MLAEVTINRSSFPFEVFNNNLANCFKDLARQHSIPADFLGTTALFTVAALSGNMYTTGLNGRIKNIIYAMLVGPSGLGKSPAYNILCGDIVAPLEAKLFDEFKLADADYKRAKDAAKKGGLNINEPHRKIRTSNGGTTEGIMRHAQYTAAGFGIYYDEGEKLFNSPNQYKKESSSNGFWNEIWNGKAVNELRADSDRERFIRNCSISVLGGMQTDRLPSYFTKDAIDSGLPARFILTCSDYIELNEHVDFFSEAMHPCSEWVDIIYYLFNKGAYDFYKDDMPLMIPFHGEAKQVYNEIHVDRIKESNLNRFKVKKGDVSEMMQSYDVKLYAYIGRFTILLAIIDNHINPVITERHVLNAHKLYIYYRTQAEKVFKKIHLAQQMDLSETQQLLLSSLPDNEFTVADAMDTCRALKLSDKFFEMNFNRKYKHGWIKKVSRGIYIKDI